MNGHDSDAALGIGIGNNRCEICRPSPQYAGTWTCYCGTPAAWAKANQPQPKKEDVDAGRVQEG